MDTDNEYTCYECGSMMERADEDVLVCRQCGHSVDVQDYVTEEEDYEALYGFCGGENSEDFPGERYDDVYGKDLMKEP